MSIKSGYLSKYLDIDKIARIISIQPIGKFRQDSDIQHLNNATGNISKDSTRTLSKMIDRRVFKKLPVKKIF